MTGHAIRWAGEVLELLPERAVWWPSQRAMLVTDVHLGKDQVFRRNGIAVPAGPTTADLDALGDLLTRFRPDRLVILGDLVHAPPTPRDTWAAELHRWREAHAHVNVQLVRGNHDRRIERWLTRWRIDHDPEPTLGCIRLAHEPPRASRHPVLSGHLHPVVKLRDGRRGTLRMPCFWFTGSIGVLPSFGGFTGGMVIEPDSRDGLFGVAPGRVLPLKPLRKAVSS